MAIPKPRKEGQTGGGGRHGHGDSRAKSWARGGRPSAGGGGTGRKPPKKGCAVAAIGLGAGLLAAAYGIGDLTARIIGKVVD